MSTPNFIKDLTSTCEKVLETEEDKMEFLKLQLEAMNHGLPATTYIPILSQSQRNYMAL